MFTGHYPAALSASWEAPLDDTFTTLAEVLHARGYATAGFVANTSYAGWESGLTRGFAHYQDYELTLGQVLHSSGVLRWLRQRSWFRNTLGVVDVLGRRDAPAVNAAFMRWFAANSERPVFAFLNYYDAHAPYLPPEPYRSEFGTPGLRQNPLLLYEAHIEGYPPEAVQHELEAYEGAIAYLDSQVGRLIDELERRGALENTLLIITSDHGEEFDEHGRLGHGNSLYTPVVQVPLIIRFAPTIPAGTRVTTPVSLVDLPATILDLLRIVEHGMPGTSLARTWTGKGHARPVLSEEYDMQSVLISDYHYIVKGEDRAEELYHVGTDEWEQDNLATRAEMEPLLACLRAASNHRFVGAHECTTDTEDSQ
jgi:arylsulfatase A-like enzyme